MSAALSPPFTGAALLLCLAGALKQRSPQTAAGALRTLGLPGSTGLVRVLGVGELGLGGLCAIHLNRVAVLVLTGAYVTFAGVAAALARRRAACGCFGEDETPMSAVHVLASVALGAVAAAAAAAGPQGLGWVLERPAATAAVLATGIAGALYAVMLLYTELPAAWAAWSGQ